MSSHPGIPIVGAAIIGCLVYFGAGPRAEAKQNFVPLKASRSNLEGVRYNGNRPDATLTVWPPESNLGWQLDIFDGNILYEPREQANAPAAERWSYEYRTHRYAIDYTRDFGAWTGFRVARTTDSNAKGDVGLDVGFRYSPLRLAYGVVSPDVLVSPRQAGLGISLYPPSQSVAPVLQHFGVGLAYMADYRGGSGLMPYVALSTRF